MEIARRICQFMVDPTKPYMSILPSTMIIGSTNFLKWICHGECLVKTLQRPAHLKPKLISVTSFALATPKLSSLSHECLVTNWEFGSVEPTSLRGFCRVNAPDFTWRFSRRAKWELVTSWHSSKERHTQLALSISLDCMREVATIPLCFVRRLKWKRCLK